MTQRTLRTVSPRESDRRRRNDRAGRRAEGVAALLLRIKGYRIAARRVRSPLGELDIVATRAGTLVFVEVKHRATLEAARTAFGARQAERMVRGAEHWVARNDHFRDYERRYDLVLLAPGRWPRHLRNVLGAFDVKWHT